MIFLGSEMKLLANIVLAQFVTNRTALGPRRPAVRLL